VIDNGIGIEEKDLEKIFEPFFTRKEKGTGFGLAIVRRIIEDHRGRITCRSKEFNVTDIHFERGKWDLSSSAKEYLTKYSLSLQESFTGQSPPTIYVVGLAGKERGEKQKWILSARRAQSVADFLRQNLPENSKWRLYCWGAGRGGQWSNDTGPMNKDAEIMISVLSE